MRLEVNKENIVDDRSAANDYRNCSVGRSTDLRPNGTFWGTETPNECGVNAQQRNFGLRMKESDSLWESVLARNGAAFHPVK